MKFSKSVTSVVTLTLLSASFHCDSANAGSSVATAECREVEDLIEFVADETGYPLLRSCPKVTVAPDFVLRSLFMKASAHGEEPMAAFVSASSEILLSPSVDLADLLGRSYMVHELVHASQLENGMKALSTCLSLPESEAYWVQASYLRKHGLNEDALTFELVSMMQSACAHPYHR